MGYLALVCIAFGFSAVGTLPVGIINLSVTKRAMDRGLKSGFLSALGAALVIYFYTFLALYFIDYFTRNAIIGDSIQIIGIIVFLTLGIYYSVKKSKIPEQKIAEKGHYKDFGFGAGIAVMNTLFVPYWIFIGLWLQTNGFSFHGIPSVAIAALGSALGALVTFSLYVKLGDYVVGSMQKIVRYTNRVLSLLFFALAVITMIRYFF